MDDVLIFPCWRLEAIV